MSGDVQPIPAGYHSVTPYLVIHDAAAAIEFYKAAFGAEEVMRFSEPSGKIHHAEIKLGDSRLMWPEMGARGPDWLGGSPVSLHLYVADADALAERALAAGAKVVRPVQDQFYGDRTGTLVDPYGHIWHIASHKEDVPMDELKRRAEAAMKGSG